MALSPKEIEKAVEMRRAGCHVRQIATRLRRGMVAIRGALAANGFKPRESSFKKRNKTIVEEYNCGRTLAQVASRVSTKRRTVLEVLIAAGVEIRPEGQAEQGWMPDDALRSDVARYQLSGYEPGVAPCMSCPFHLSAIGKYRGWGWLIKDNGICLNCELRQLHDAHESAGWVPYNNGFDGTHAAVVDVR